MSGLRGSPFAIGVLERFYSEHGMNALRTLLEGPPANSYDQCTTTSRATTCIRASIWESWRAAATRCSADVFRSTFLRFSARPQSGRGHARHRTAAVRIDLA